MATIAERCNQCGRIVWVQQGTQAFQCNLCGAVTRRLQTTYAPWNQPPYGYPYGDGFAHPIPLLPPPRPPPPAAVGRKKALVCGVNYYGKYSLQGSVNDAKSMRKFLAERFGFPWESILMLTDDERDPLTIPTKRNLLIGMQWLVEGCQSGDSLVFFFSGHGSRVVDENWDEVDGYDEALCPVDFTSAGKLIDDDINEIIVRPLLPGVKLHAIVDTCYSGTVLDLRHVCKRNWEGLYMWEDHGCPSGIYKGTRGGLAVCISACDDHQNSADTRAFTGSFNAAAGALTYSFIQALKIEPGLTYANLLSTIRHAVRKAQSSITTNYPYAFPHNRFDAQPLQEPQVSSSAPFDIYTKKFTL